MILGKKIDGFPYVSRICVYCHRKLQMMAVVHLQDEPENYKALFYCLNDGCEVFDEAARKCYALVYYSTPKAEQHLYSERIWMPKREER